MGIFKLLAASSLVFTSLQASAQDPQKGPEQPHFKSGVQLSRYRFTTQVTPEGQKPGNFELWDVRKLPERKKLDFVFVEPMKEQVHGMDLLIAVDDSMSMKWDGASKAVKATLKQFIDGFRPTDRVQIIPFDHRIDVTGPLTSEKAPLRAQIEKLTAKGLASQAYGSVIDGIDNYKKKYANDGVKRQKVLVLLTDGESNYPNLESVDKSIKDSGFTVFPIQVVSRPTNQSDIFFNRMEVLATATGGSAYSWRSQGAQASSNLLEIYRNIQREVSSVHEIGVYTDFPPKDLQVTYTIPGTGERVAWSLYPSGIAEKSERAPAAREAIAKVNEVSSALQSLNGSCPQCESAQSEQTSAKAQCDLVSLASKPRIRLLGYESLGAAEALDELVSQAGTESSSVVVGSLVQDELPQDILEEISKRKSSLHVFGAADPDAFQITRNIRNYLEISKRLGIKDGSVNAEKFTVIQNLFVDYNRRNWKTLARPFADSSIEAVAVELDAWMAKPVGTKPTSDAIKSLKGFKEPQGLLVVLSGMIKSQYAELLRRNQGDLSLPPMSALENQLKDPQRVAAPLKIGEFDWMRDFELIWKTEQLAKQVRLQYCQAAKESRSLDILVRLGQVPLLNQLITDSMPGVSVEARSLKLQ